MRTFAVGTDKRLELFTYTLVSEFTDCITIGALLIGFEFSQFIQFFFFFSRHTCRVEREIANDDSLPLSDSVEYLPEHPLIRHLVWLRALKLNDTQLKQWRTSSSNVFVNAIS